MTAYLKKPESISVIVYTCFWSCQGNSSSSEYSELDDYRDTRRITVIRHEFKTLLSVNLTTVGLSCATLTGVIRAV